MIHSRSWRDEWNDGSKPASLPALGSTNVATISLRVRLRRAPLLPDGWSGVSLSASSCRYSLYGFI